MQDRHTLLIVDDDLELARMLKEYLAAEDHCIQHAASGEQALDLLKTQSFDLIILDIMMPGLDGLQVLSRLGTERQVSVLMLTARGQDDDRILGLELGADDYLSKPFNPRELSARIRAILRRRDRKQAAPRPPIRVGPLALDPADFSVTMLSQPVRVTAAEFLVLEVLAAAAGMTQSRALLTERSLGRPLEAYDRSIDTHVSNLRRKLGLRPDSGIEIRSVRGEGYLLTARSGQI